MYFLSYMTTIAFSFNLAGSVDVVVGIFAFKLQGFNSYVRQGALRQKAAT